MRIDDVAPLLDPTAPPRVLSRSHAEQLGFTDDAVRHRLAIGKWQRLLPHTYLTSDTITWDDRRTAAVVFAGDGALLSGAAALCDLGLRSVSRPSSILVLVPPQRCPRSVAWVRVRPSARPVRQAFLPGPPRADEARAVADLALERRRLDDVRALVAEAVRLRLCTIEELAAELRHGPQRGSAHLRQAIDEVGGGSWSAPEARAATLMRRAGLPRFEQNAVIELRNGRRLTVDFLWRELRAVPEIDSDAHHSLAGDADWTSDRHLLLATDGYSVIHRTPRYVIKRPATFIDGVGQWLAARARELAASQSA
jgi:very-short-patch-repair endonuclease